MADRNTTNRIFTRRRILSFSTGVLGVSLAGCIDVNLGGGEGGGEDGGGNGDEEDDGGGDNGENGGEQEDDGGQDDG